MNLGFYFTIILGSAKSASVREIALAIQSIEDDSLAELKYNDPDNSGDVRQIQRVVHNSTIEG